MDNLYRRIRPILFRLDSELVHDGVKTIARCFQPLTRNVLRATCEYGHATLHQRVWGMDFPNPIGLAAGFDKNAQLLKVWEAMGFGFAEVGSITAQPSRGNRRPRMFRLEQDQALVNRLGLPNQGAFRVGRRLRRETSRLIRGINLAKTHDPSIIGHAAIEDYRRSFAQLAPLGHYVALNVSCPNTADGHTFAEAVHLEALLSAIMLERSLQRLKVPVLVKLSPPDSPKVVFDSRIERILEIAIKYRVNGFIVCNTASDRIGLSTGEDRVAAIGTGGLSGRPIHGRAVRMVQYIYQQTQGRLPIIGVGGVASAEDAFRMICAGASLVQVYTGLVYEGPGLVRRMKEGLVYLLAEHGFTSVESARGSRAGDFSAQWAVPDKVLSYA